MEKKTATDINPFFEWAVWGHLESEKNLELILLKGHLLLEVVLESVLRYFDFENPENYSFYHKIVCFEKLNFPNEKNQAFMSNCLKNINSLRNKLAHEFQFNVENGELEKWSLEILENLRGMKWTKYTTRTKIIHSFSILSRNLLDLKN